MDPNLFHLDWERTFEALGAIVVLAMLVERALAVLFESRFWVERDHLRPWQEPVAIVVAFAVCRHVEFDAIAIIMVTDRAHLFGEVVTALVIAGGTKGSIKLFRDVLGFQSSSYKQRGQLRADFQSRKARAGAKHDQDPPNPADH